MRIYALIAGILMFAACALAQDSSQVDQTLIIRLAQNKQPAEKDQNYTYIEKLPSRPDSPEDMRVFTAMAEAASVVKNAPYTATETTETIQTLGDGNHITSKSSASLARDGEGRTRREESGLKLGSLQGSGPKIVVINDPVAHTRYMFQPGETSNGENGVMNMRSIKPKVQTFRIAKSETTGSVVDKVMFGIINARGTKTWVTIGDDTKLVDADVKRESLGTQVIEGITAEGKRDTRTIPAGAIGNEKPIVITSETWTSPELQEVVLSKRNDPRFGETVYKLTGITRGEPDPSLFQPPSNFKKDLPAPPK
ncbi:MAG TPA: hypothetical protein VKY85_08270 [Candidatus Angelobacter sp.]|nr:hypothetical protein [Candidatus Angelobacter sp.]